MKNLKRTLVYIGVLFLFTTCSKDSSGDKAYEPENVQYELKVNIIPEGSGTVTPSSGKFNKGQQVTITTTPSSNKFEFNNWSGGASGNESTVTITMNSNKNITANYSEVPPIYANGEGEIGPIGGTVKIQDESSPWNGTSIIIPEGALETKEDIRISVNEAAAFPYDENVQMIKLEPSGLEFLQDVEIVLPYNDIIRDTTSIRAFNYDFEEYKIEELEVIKVDEDNKLVHVLANHFSWFYTEDSPIKLSTEMIKVGGKIGARVKVEGYGSLNGLRRVPTNKAHDGVHLKIWDCIMDIGNHPTAYSEWDVELWERKINATGNPDKKTTFKFSVKRESDYSAKVFVEGNNTPVLSTKPLEQEDIGPTKQSLGKWLSGEPMVVVFDEFEPAADREYHVKILFRINDGPTFLNLFSPQYYVNSYRNRKSFNNSMDYTNNTLIPNIDDSFVPLVPSVNTEDPTDITNTTAKLNGSIISDGSLEIIEHGFYYATHANITDSDDRIVAEMESDNAFSATVDLLPNYNYHYKAFAVNSEGENLSSNEVHFQTPNSAPGVDITNPAPYTVQQKGVEILIRATAADNDGGLKSVAFFIDDSLVKEYTSTQNDYTYAWDTSSATLGEHIIRVTATDIDDVLSFDEHIVKIVDGNLEITKPDATTIWNEGDQNVEISWETGNLGGTVNIELEQNDIKRVTLNGTEPTENDGSFMLDVPEGFGEGDNYSIKIVSVKYPNKSAKSEYFEISDPNNLAPIIDEQIFYPEHEGTIADTFTSLTWQASDPEDEPLTFDVFFGNSEDPPKKATVTANKYNLIDLIEGETYYWKIQAFDTSNNSTTSPIWKFTIVPNVQTGSINISVFNFDQSFSPYPGSNGIVELYRNDVLMYSQITDQSGIARFSEIEVGDYDAKIYHEPIPPTPHGKEYWGKKNISVITDVLVNESFIRNTPRMLEGLRVTNLPPFDDQDLSGSNIKIYTPLQIHGKIGGVTGSETFPYRFRILIDRDKNANYDFEYNSSGSSIGANGTHKLDFPSMVFEPKNPGEYYFSMNVEVDLKGNGEFIVADGWDWSEEPLFTVLEDRIIFNPNLSYGTLTDIDGNTYKTIQIGAQNWMAENLKTTRLNNGIPLEERPSSESVWENTYSQAYANARTTYDTKTYGKWYNLYAARSSRICPEGWNVPSNEEWNILLQHLGANPGGKLKEVGLNHWRSPNQDASNSSGFTAIGSGTRYSNGGIGLFEELARYWTSTDSGGIRTYSASLTHDGSNITLGTVTNEGGLCIRCIESENLPLVTPVVRTGVRNESEVRYFNGAYRLSLYGSIENYTIDQVNEKGFYWGTSPNVSSSGAKLVSNSYPVDSRYNFSFHSANIIPNTTYYYQAYALNDAGEGLGEEYSLRFEDANNTTSIIPPHFNGRPNNNLGTINVSSRNITISVWDHQAIDGDIVSIYVNGERVIAERTLSGPESKYSVNVTLDYNGYNYLLLYAHNVGSSPPNTCAISINDGANTEEFILESNLEENGAIDLIVN